MKSYVFVPALVVAALFLSACQTATGEDETLSFVDQDVILAVEENALPVQWVEASFLSGEGSFSYRFEYNNYLLQLLDTPVENPADFGPHFEVEGGAEIKGYTRLVDKAESEATGQSEVQIIGKHRVSRTSFALGDCTLQKAMTEFSGEVLVFELQLCPGDNEDRGEEALEALFDELSFVLL